MCTSRGPWRNRHHARCTGMARLSRPTGGCFSGVHFVSRTSVTRALYLFLIFVLGSKSAPAVRRWRYWLGELVTRQHAPMAPDPGVRPAPRRVPLPGAPRWVVRPGRPAWAAHVHGARFTRTSHAGPLAHRGRSPPHRCVLRYLQSAHRRPDKIHIHRRRRSTMSTHDHVVMPDHPFVPSDDPRFGAAFGGACDAMVPWPGLERRMIVCGWPRLAHPRTYAVESTAHAELDYPEPSDYGVVVAERGARWAGEWAEQEREAARGDEVASVPVDGRSNKITRLRRRFFPRRTPTDTPPCPSSLSPRSE